MRGINPDMFLQPLSKIGVTRVSGVSSASIQTIFETPENIEGVTRVSNQAENISETQSVTPETPAEIKGVSRKPASIKDETPETPVTLEKEYVCYAIDLEALYEHFTERAGIMEYDGGLDREIAERQALVAVIEKVFAKEPRRLSWIN